MVLQIIGNPCVVPKSVRNRVLVDYDEQADITTVTLCDVDVVTLGIAVEILTEQYYKCLQGLSPYEAGNIRQTIRKAVGAYGQDSGKNNQSSSNC